MPPQRKKRGKGKEKKVERLWGWTQAAGAWAERCGTTSAGGRELRLEPRCTVRRGEEPDDPPSPKESRCREGDLEKTEAAKQATGRGDGAEAVGSERAHLAASARSCPSPFSVDTNTSPKPKQQQRSTTRSSSCAPLPPSPLGLPPTPPPGPPRAPSASRPAARCRQFRIQRFSTRFVLFFYKKRRGNSGGGQPGTHTPAFLPRQKQMHFDF